MESNEKLYDRFDMSATAEELDCEVVEWVSITL